MAALGSTCGDGPPLCAAKVTVAYVGYGIIFYSCVVETVSEICDSTRAVLFQVKLLSAHVIANAWKVWLSNIRDQFCSFCLCSDMWWKSNDVKKVRK